MTYKIAQIVATAENRIDEINDLFEKLESWDTYTYNKLSDEQDELVRFVEGYHTKVY